MTLHRAGKAGAGAPAEGQRTPPMTDPLDPGPEGRQPINNNNVSEPTRPKATRPTVSGRKRRVKPIKTPDIIP
jgi:hypothetical protein